MNGIFAFAPNRMGHNFSNRGVEHLIANRGHGVDRLKPKLPVEDEKESNPGMNKIRVSTARQSGKKKTEVGF